MKITGFGNASVRVEADGQSFFFDPYHKDLVKTEETVQQRRQREEAFLQAQKVFITHGHFDHLGSIAGLYRNRDAIIYCTETPVRTLCRQGFPRERIRQVKPGDTLRFGEVAISIFHTKHCRFNGGEIWNVLLHHGLVRRFGAFFKLLWFPLTYPAGDECLLYEITWKGQRVQLLGSAGLDAGTEYVTGADALVLPYQGRSDMPSYCVRIVERLKPKKVYLNHYDNAFPPMTCQEDTAPFMELMYRKHSEITCAALREAEPIDL